MIHPQAIVDDEGAIGDGTRVWAFAHVMSGARLGENCNVGEHVFIERHACVGDNVTLKNNVLVWEGITLEDDVFVGPAVVFTNDRFPRSPRMPAVAERYEKTENWLERTVVRRGVSIGAGSTICPGLELGQYAMIAAGSVVTKDVPPYAMVMGAPARHVGDVCRCGQRLMGAYCETDCSACGEQASARVGTD